MTEHTRERWRGVPAGVPCWHIHHGILLEWSTEPLETRVKCFREVKALDETPEQIAIRERLLAPVQGKLPVQVIEAGRAYAEARRAYVEARRALDEARRAYVEARRAYDEAMASHRDEIEALHQQECPKCPWDGKTIFPGT